MANQLTLASFSDPDQFREPTKKIYDCQNCNLFQGFVAGPKVKCMGRNKEIPKNGCACWSDGKELKYMASFAPPAGFIPKKWRGEV